MKINYHFLSIFQIQQNFKNNKKINPYTTIVENGYGWKVASILAYGIVFVFFFYDILLFFWHCCQDCLAEGVYKLFSLDSGSISKVGWYLVLNDLFFSLLFIWTHIFYLVDLRSKQFVDLWYFRVQLYVCPTHLSCFVYPSIWNETGLNGTILWKNCKGLKSTYLHNFNIVIQCLPLMLFSCFLHCILSFWLNYSYFIWIQIGTNGS